VTQKQEREYARRRHEKWLAHQAAVKARQQRRRKIAAGVLAGVITVGAVLLVVSVVRSSGSSAAAAPTPTASAPPASLAEGRTWTSVLTTSVGAITLELDGSVAPQAVANFVSLSQSGFYEGTSCHRLTTAATDGLSVLQCGDPTGSGIGGPGYTWGPIENAPADNLYPAGTVAMARTSGDGSSMGSQFFLVYEDSTIPADSAGGYTVLGHITNGLDLVQQVGAAGISTDSPPAPATPVTIEKVETK